MTESGSNAKLEYCPRCNGDTPHRVRRLRWHWLLMGLGPVIALVAPLPWLDAGAPQDHLDHVWLGTGMAAGLTVPALAIATVLLRVRQWRLVCAQCGKSWRLDSGVAEATHDWGWFEWRGALLLWAIAQVAMFAGASAAYVYAARAASWRSTPGVVRESRLDVSESEGITGLIERRYRVRFTYEYTVDGVSYEGHRIDPDGPIMRERGSSLKPVDTEPIDRELAGYRPGKSVTVWYNPSKPSESALELNEAGFGVWLWAVGAAASVGMLVAAVRVKQPGAPGDPKLRAAFDEFMRQNR